VNRISLIEGDALVELSSLNDESVDLIIADPPYNLGKDYGNNNDRKSKDEYLEFSYKWLSQAKRVLSPDGSLYVFMGFKHISHIYNILENDLRMNFVNWICWHYTQGIGKTKGYSPRHDDILLFSKSSKFIFNLDAVRVPQKYYRKVNNMRGANPGDVWEFSHVHFCHENRQIHPTQKPEGLIERMVLASSCEGNKILDPFCGSGTTLRVCQQLKRNAIGIEINPEYVEMIRARLSKPFSGFDSIDPRMKRVPNDLNDPLIRKEYLDNHIQWFLRYHTNDLKEFLLEVREKYPDTKVDLPVNSEQQELFD